MAAKAISRKEVVLFLRQHHVLQVSDLAEHFECSERTIFRILKEEGYLASYNGNGAGLTLAEMPEFNNNGIWEYQGFLFSRWGTLKKTIPNIVHNSEVGLSAGELREILRHDNIYHHLTYSVEAEQIFRIKQWKIPIYYSKDPERRQEQSNKRKELLQTTSTESNLFDIETAQLGTLSQLLLQDAITADEIYDTLEGMGKILERKDIEEIILRHNLDQKKTMIELVFAKEK